MNEVMFGTCDISLYGFVAESKVDGAPPRDYSEIVVPGKNGTVHIDNGRYNNCEQIYNCVVYDDYTENMRALRNALCSQVGYQRLEDEFNPDEFYMAIYKGEFSPIQKRGRKLGYVNLAFERKPQRFLKSGEIEKTFTADGEIWNETEFDAKPLLKFTRDSTTSGTISIGIGSSTITFEGVPASTVVYMDCETMEAWSLSGTAKVSQNASIKLSGNAFPVLKPGRNGIDFQRGISSLVITPRWWRL